MEGLESMTPLESEKKDLMARLGEIYYKKCKESGNVTAEEAGDPRKNRQTGSGDARRRHGVSGKRVPRLRRSR